MINRINWISGKKEVKLLALAFLVLSVSLSFISPVSAQTTADYQCPHLHGTYRVGTNLRNNWLFLTAQRMSPASHPFTVDEKAIEIDAPPWKTFYTSASESPHILNINCVAETKNGLIVIARKSVKASACQLINKDRGIFRCDLIGFDV